MKTIAVSENKHTTMIQLMRPEKRNAFNQEMIAELTSAFSSISATTRLVLLSGAGQSFSAGADLGWMQAMAKYSFTENQADSRKLHEMYLALQRLPVPVIAKVQGHVMGGALGLVALSDLVAAETATQFCFSEVRLGLAPAVVSEFVAEKIPRGQLSRWLLTAEVFSAPQALAMGLVNFIGGPGECDEWVQGICQKLLANGPQAVRATKQLIRKVYRGDTDVSEHNIELISRLRAGAEGQEGLAAFFSKRQPTWVES